MKIEKYKKINNGKYIVYFEKENKYTLYEDVILKYNLLIKKQIDLKTLDNILKDNKFYDAFYLSVNYISKKIRTKKEIQKYLEQKNIDNIIIQKVINELTNKKYLNDELYIKAYIHDKVYLTNDGPIKIKNNLINLGFSENIIIEQMNLIPKEDWEEKIIKYINKQKKLNKKYSNYILNNKIKSQLIMKGYPSNMFDDYLTEYDEIKE